MFSPSRAVRVFSALPGLLIIGFLLIMFVIFPDILIPMIKNSSSIASICWSVLCFALFTWCYVLSWWSYVKCVFTHPGPVSANYLRDYDERYGLTNMRFCSKCDQKKPPRCHHCNICRMCIVNMDHHCPWMCNCIGYHNKKFFVQFLVYAWIGCVEVTVLSIQMIIPYLKAKRYLRSHLLSSSFVVIAVLFAFSFAITLTFFGGFHVWLVFNDSTTLESSFRFFNFFNRNSQRRRNKEYYKNWCIIMGSKPALWLIPIHEKNYQFKWDFMEKVMSDSDSEDLRDDSLFLQSDLRRLKESLPLIYKVPDV